MVAQNKYEVAFSHDSKRNKTKGKGGKKKKNHI
jgi:hypothetical protein